MLQKLVDRKKINLLWLLLLPVLAIAQTKANISSTRTTIYGQATPASTSKKIALPLPKKPAPTLRLKRDDGKMEDVGAMSGKVVFLNFWATSCIPCKAEMPTIDRLQVRYQHDTNIVILPVDLDNDLQGSLGFMNEHKLKLHVYTIASALPKSVFNGVLPTTVVIGRDGGIAMYKEGESDYSTGGFYRFVDSLARQ